MGDSGVANRLTVQIGSALQLQTAILPRRAKHLEFQRLALSPSSEAATPAAAAGPAPQLVVPALLQTLLPLGCGNKLKEPCWRLVLDTFPKPQRMHKPLEMCCRDEKNAGRVHHFWQYPVAQRVVVALDAELTAAAAWHNRQHTPITVADL